MNGQFDELRQELNSLGYPQKLHPECIPLVKKLLGDLDVTTTNLQKYMKISQYALEEKDLLEAAAEPYKCDNAKLIKECNDLHLAFIHFKEQHERIQRDLRKQLSSLQSKLDNCILEKQSLIKEIQQLNRDKMKKGSRSQEPGRDKVSQVKTNSEKKFRDELNEIRDKYQKVVEENVMLENQLAVREEEIKRLHSRTENGRPLKELDGDCCYKNFDNKIKILQDEINRFKLEKNELQLQTEEALAKQHEAMRRALHLLERNKQLEREIQEMDQIALAVETQCNDSIRTSSQQLVSLEKENSLLRKAKTQLKADLEAVRLEKNHIQKQLEFEVEDKKRLTDRINNYTLIENDLNLEIDRLTRLVGEQKIKIAELDSQVKSDQIDNRQSTEKKVSTVDSVTQANEMSNRGSQTIRGMKPPKHPKGETKKAGVRTKRNKSPTRIDSVVPSGACQKCCCESGNCIRNFKDLLDKELEFRQESTLKSLEVLKDEKEYFMREYHKALEQLRSNSINDASDNLIAELRQQLREKEGTISKLETQMHIMSKERNNLMMDSESNICMNPNCKRRLREMDIQKDELRHLEMENNTLKAKLQTLNETTLFNEDRMKKAFQDMEEHIRRLEDERRDLVKAEVTQRSNISHLEEDYKAAKEQLRQTQMELSGLRTNYNQLKLLHEQTDRSLAEVQAKMLRAETELAQYQSRVKDSSRENVLHDREVAKLNSDVQIMKNQLTRIDSEKDDLLNKLDEKTEENALLEDQLQAKNKALASLEAELKELRRKLSKFIDESNSQDQVVRSKQQELSHLEQEFDRERRLKEAALLENKRIQNDLTCVTADCRDARTELEICKRQIEDLKRQLQQYVSEVKRTEDLISQKELERSELLDQFKSLSQEHNLLESNNHTLETEATQSKIQLSVALDHTTELERRVQNQESIIRSYEKQITDLTAQVASLEIQLQQEAMAQERNSSELKQMRDLCVRLDKDKDLLKSELTSKEEVRSQVGKSTEKLRSEKEYLEKALDKERSSLEGVERLLNEARQEVMDQRLLNQDLQSEVAGLKNKITELQERLTITSDQLDIYQEKALDYSQQNKQLRREIANERFAKSRADDKGYYPSL
ncbi:centrosomal protein 135kDa isoform X2 [Rhynchophorus ferrugineus]|uniref:centrosomal protein 135kDa isoform X2 n=1 Tax=Rhynchophorus ferrugineus TaxID=354439 RepID=UPI003FCE56A2